MVCGQHQVYVDLLFQDAPASANGSSFFDHNSILFVVTSICKSLFPDLAWRPTVSAAAFTYAPVPCGTLIEPMKKALGISTLAILTLGALTYAADYAVLRVRIARNLTPYGTEKVRQYYAIGEKNQRTEYVYGSTQQQPCVNSLFGHLDLSPCWYLRRHPDQEIRI